MTDLQRIVSILRDVWDTATNFGDNDLQRQFMIASKVNELCELFAIEIDLTREELASL